MRFGIVITATDPRLAATLAAEAEAAGWDGVFTYDSIAIGDWAGFDPWVVLAAMAMRTERVRLGAIVFAPSRRRPWKLARELTTLDVLSGGRMVFPVGLGATRGRGLRHGRRAGRGAHAGAAPGRDARDRRRPRVRASRSRSKASTTGSSR